MDDKHPVDIVQKNILFYILNSQKSKPIVFDGIELPNLIPIYHCEIRNL